MTQQRILILLTFLCPLNTVFADGFDWKLRQHSRDKNLISEPALINYTKPSDKPSSTATDFAIATTFLPENLNWEYSLSFEKHKNTLVSKPQNVEALVMAVEGSFGNVERGYSFVPEISLAYKIDKQNDSESVLAIAELTGIYGKYGINFLMGNDKLKWTWSPTIGMEYDNIVDARDDSENDQNSDGLNGSVGRLYTDIDITFYPFFAKLDSGRLSVSLSFSNWSDFSESNLIDDGKDSHSLQSHSIKWQLNKTPPEGEKRITTTLSLKWLDGEDPRNNKADQTYHGISLGFLY